MVGQPADSKLVESGDGMPSDKLRLAKLIFTDSSSSCSSAPNCNLPNVLSPLPSPSSQPWSKAALAGGPKCM
eukprot:CAMPEP_0206437796 /NCGR_PEP_ID=MMETSP0324_2-20121206/11244_1 /ASSEMBLY_ACC=CAM_ASM_000836 /TAXON_ID=2866 /ORGANISM="Crypthecodinium cohnii, Strain Seligo" /LENGTH=71 /DNA_ID=CAMNT_0053905125 /DNA_START=473 /DNA_END=688 /DNA_ORIENTATION=-